VPIGNSAQISAFGFFEEKGLPRRRRLCVAIGRGLPLDLWNRDSIIGTQILIPMAHSRREQERGRRRELLLAAAARVFGRRPFDEASMQEVAAEAEIGMQGLYEHFPSKQELYEQVILQRALAFQARADEVLCRPGSGVELLRQLGKAYVEEFRKQPWHLAPFVRDRVNFDWDVDSRFSPRLREIYEVERRNVRGLIVRAVEAGEIQPMDPDFLTQLCLDVLQASLHHSHHNRPDETADQCIDRALGCLLRGVGVVQGSRPGGAARPGASSGA